MTKTRLEMFSDGVIAILITIMVLELRPPTGGHGYDELKHAFPAYILSFVVLAIYSNNHHHMMQLCTRVNGRIPVAFLKPYVSIALQIVVVLTWVIPDKRIESRVAR